jgi:hypothetical protein
MEKNTEEKNLTTRAHRTYGSRVHEGTDPQALFFLRAPSAPLWLIFFLDV